MRTVATKRPRVRAGGGNAKNGKPPHEWGWHDKLADWLRRASHANASFVARKAARVFWIHTRRDVRLVDLVAKMHQRGVTTREIIKAVTPYDWRREYWQEAA